MSRYRLSQEAQADLIEIGEFIARDDPAAARVVIANIRKTIRRLATTPGMGHRRSDLQTDDVRVWPIYSLLVVYRAKTRPLQILRVVSGWRDVPRELDS